MADSSRVVWLGVAALSGAVAFFALIIAHAELASLIEPHGRIEAFLLAIGHAIALLAAGAAVCGLPFQRRLFGG